MSDYEEYVELTQYIFNILEINPALLVFAANNNLSFEGLDKINIKLIEWEQEYKNRSVLFYVGILRTLSIFKNELSNWEPFLKMTKERIIQEQGEENANKILRGLI